MGIPRSNPLTSLILGFLDLDVPLVPLESPYDWLKRKNGSFKRKSYRQTLWKLRHQGFLEICEKNSLEFIKLTEKGYLKILLAKSALARPSVWDGKWRVIVFDIPEESHIERDRFRNLLKRYGFIKLQASVFISPYPLNAEAIEYLAKVGLNRFIRIMRVDQMDNDKVLKKHFNLQ